ncbi:hypothetical protein MtrunA17_Chr3g0130071 [Medicago truncatula]|uniref:Uncharacterized protein n=1 Tax=Medicago truncatula TaxID=3880 RepID=A0A396IW39_MEDTR|nr:hypothetical protein MtrunA17_Chr3g0130071 [Medicago truncatula]
MHMLLLRVASRTAQQLDPPPPLPPAAMLAGQTIIIRNKSFTDLGEGVLPFAIAAQVLSKNSISGEQTKDTLEIFSVSSAVGTNYGENLRGREWGVVSTLPDSFRYFHFENSNEGSRNTHNVCKFQNGKPRFTLRLYHSNFSIFHYCLLICFYTQN